MAKAWTKVEWNEEKIRIARDAAKAMMEKKDLTGYSKLKIEAIQKEYARTAKKMLDEKYPFDKLKDTEKDAVSNFKGEDAAKFLGLTGGNEVFRNSYDPLLKKKMDDFAKLGPLVLGLADEGRDWYNMGATDLFAKGEELGYDTKSKKGKMDFLSDVGDVQMAHDRGKLLEEFNKGTSALSDMVFPTLTEEMRKQISTGRGSTADLVLSGLLDGGANLLIGGAPSVGKLSMLSKQPFLSGVVGAISQGGLEAARQGAKTLIDDELEADLTAPLLASTLGATRPGMLGSVSALSQQIPGRGMSRFAAGVSAATRAGNPVYAEREGLEHAFDIYEKLFKSRPKRPRYFRMQNPYEEILRNGVRIKLPELRDARLAERLKGKVKALYDVDDSEKSFVDNAEDLLSQTQKDKFLADYDNIGEMSVYRDPDNYYKRLDKVVTPRAQQGYEVVNGKLRPGDYLDNLEKAFPAKMAEAYGNDNWYKAGLVLGSLLGDIGGRVEPAIKANPFAMLSGGNVNMVNTDYKETPWYKSMSKKQQEAFDDAYEKANKASE